MQIYGVYIPEKERLISYLSLLKKGKGGFFVYLAMIGLVIGGFGISSIFVLGHGATTNTSSLVPWGLQISTYVYFALVSGGCIFTNFIGNIYYHDTYKPLASRVIFMGLITAIAGFASLASELGHVERMYLFMVSPNPKSPMFWMAVWYSADITILLLEYINIQRNVHSKRLLYASFIIPVITYCSLGSLFGAVGTIPYYYSSLLPVYFLFAGFLSGNALCSIIAAFQAKKTGRPEMIKPFFKMQMIALAAVFVLHMSRIIIGVASTATGYEIFHEMLFKSIFLGGGLGLVVPFIILFYKRNISGLILSSLIVLAVQFLCRFELVVGGFRVLVFRVYDMPERISYFPSIFEILVVVASLSVVALVYLVCEKTGLFEIAGKEAQ